MDADNCGTLTGMPVSYFWSAFYMHWQLSLSSSLHPSLLTVLLVLLCAGLKLVIGRHKSMLISLTKPVIK